MKHIIAAIAALFFLQDVPAVADETEDRAEILKLRQEIEAEERRRAAEQGVSIEELRQQQDASNAARIEEIVAAAEASNPPGRYQIQASGAAVWVLDTMTGLLRICTSQSGSGVDPRAPVCGPWEYAGRDPAMDN